MKKILLFFTIFLVFQTFLISQNFKWAKGINGFGTTKMKSITSSNTGDYYTCGSFRDTLYSNTGSIPSKGGEDAFLAKHDSIGTMLWIHAFGTTSDYDKLEDVIADDSGNVFVAGHFADTITIGNVTVPFATIEPVLLKFNKNGNLLWYKKGTGYAVAYNVALDNQGMVYFSGVVNSSVTFSGTTLTNSSNLFNGWMAKYNSHTGTFVSATMISGGGGERGPYGMKADNSGNVYWTGYDRPSQNPYVGAPFVKRTQTGSSGWAYNVSSAFGNIYGRDVAIDCAGNIYFTGNIYNNVTFINQNIGQYGKYNNAFLAKFSPSGTLLWVKQYGSTGDDIGWGLATDQNCNIYWTGSFYSQIILDTITVNARNNSRDIFVAKFNSSGNVMWAKSCGSYGDDYPVGITYNINQNKLAIAGYYYASMLFDTIPLAQTGGSDGFLAVITLPADTSITTSSGSIDSNIPVQAFYSNEEIHIITDNAKLFPADVVIYDMSGKILLNIKINGACTIPVNDLPKGMYILQFRTRDENKTFRLLK